MERIGLTPQFLQRLQAPSLSIGPQDIQEVSDSPSRVATGSVARPNRVVSIPFVGRDGRFRTVSENFSIPKVPCSLAWQFWCCGNSSDNQKYGPIRRLKGATLGKKVQKQLNKFAYVMRRMENHVRSLNLWVVRDNEDPSIDEAQLMFEAGKSVLVNDAVTAKGQQRRVSQIKWSTMYNLMRERDKASS